MAYEYIFTYYIERLLSPRFSEIFPDSAAETDQQPPILQNYKENAPGLDPEAIHSLAPSTRMVSSPITSTTWFGVSNCRRHELLS